MKIVVLGAGKVGTTISTMLQSCDFCTTILLSDIEEMPELKNTSKLDFRSVDFNNKDEVTRLVAGQDAVVSAAPFYLNRMIAECCAEKDVAYFDLTEDVATTAHIRKLAQQSPVVFMPQCGLAPGAINIIAGSYARMFNHVRSLELRVGALPLYASNSMKYYLSWSTAGLINEYCQLAEALHEGRRIQTLPLEGLERLTISSDFFNASILAFQLASACTQDVK